MIIKRKRYIYAVRMSAESEVFCFVISLFSFLPLFRVSFLNSFFIYLERKKKARKKLHPKNTTQETRTGDKDNIDSRSKDNVVVLEPFRLGESPAQAGVFRG